MGGFMYQEDVLNQGDVLMTGSGSAVLAPEAGTGESKSETAREEVDTRFGKVTITRDNPIMFPSGMLGMPEKNSYCLTAFPSQKFERFKLLQSLDDESLGFVTLPLEPDNGIIARDDIAQAAKDLKISQEHLALLLIVSVHRETEGVRLSVNARAPILMDAVKRSAHQYVFASNKYQIRHMITL
jgi:flagellar assembly factor FliW